MDLSEYRVILASKSPRRKELLKKITGNFEIITANVDEYVPKGTPPRLAVEHLALKKGAPVSSSCGQNAIVISSDTLVEQDGCPLGKPKDFKDAERMLKKLSGRAHNVHTGVAVYYGGKVYSGVATTKVVFRKISEKEIFEYIESGEPMDKAGAYGIQGEGRKFVESYDGDFDTVVGLSIGLTEKLIREALESR